MSLYLTRTAIIVFWLLIWFSHVFTINGVKKASVPKFHHFDKVIHIILFSTLTTVDYLAYDQRKYLYIGLASYGVLTETVTRYASIYDWLADITGILLSILIIRKLVQRLQVKQPQNRHAH